VETKASLVLLLVFLASLYYRSVQISGSVLAGGVTGLLSFWLLRRGMEGMVQRQQESGQALKAGLLVLKYPILFGLIAFVILKTPVHVIAWVAGFLSLVIAIVLEGLLPSKD